MVSRNHAEKQTFTHWLCEIVIITAIFGVAFFPRVMALDEFSVMHESRWLNRSFGFLESVGQGDWQSTLDATRPPRDFSPPGITTMWAGALGILTYYLPQICFEQAGIYVAGSL